MKTAVTDYSFYNLSQGTNKEVAFLAFCRGSFLPIIPPVTLNQSLRKQPLDGEQKKVIMSP